MGCLEVLLERKLPVCVSWDDFGIQNCNVKNVFLCATNGILRGELTFTSSLFRI